jgi:hypothetical protein
VGGRWLPFKGRRGTAEREGGSNSGDAMCYGDMWGLAPIGGRRPDRVPAAARTGGAPLFRQWRADAANARAPAGGGRGSEERGAGACGPARRNAEWAESQMNINI